MKKVAKLTLKPKYIKVLKIVGFVLCIFLIVFLFYLKQIHDLTSIGYSREASRRILFSFKKDVVLKIGENATVNKAFESSDYVEDNLDSYKKIKFVDQEHFILHINQLLEKKYSTNDINIIFAHGDDGAVSRFIKRDKVHYLEEFYSIPYAKLDYYDRYSAYSDETGEDEDLTVLYVNLDLDKEDYTDSTLEDKYSPDMLVNKHHHLSEDFVPSDLMTIDSKYAVDDITECSTLAFIAYRKMSDAAEKDGYQIVINSAYRSYQDQVDLSDLYLRTYGQNYVDRFVAKPGYSEHQTGLAFDIGSRNTNVFANSKEYEWMQNNAYKYGFINRYTKKDEAITQFRNEPWHYRYVEEKIAKYIQENNISFEEYWAMFLDK